MHYVSVPGSARTCSSIRILQQGECQLSFALSAPLVVFA